MGGSAVAPGVIAEAVAAAKLLLRVDDAAEDALLARLAATAIGIGEAFCGQALFVRPFEDVLAARADWQRLGVVPVTAIAGATALPVSGAPTVLPIEAYQIDIDADGTGWVRLTGAGGRVAMSYSAGLAPSWAALPVPLAQGVALLVQHLFEHREGDATPPAAVAALWRPFRRMRMLVEGRPGDWVPSTATQAWS